jgi:hypothetical protein
LTRRKKKERSKKKREMSTTDSTTDSTTSKGPRGASLFPSAQILLTGATGYIGGSILAHVLQPDSSFRKAITTKQDNSMPPIKLLLRDDEAKSRSKKLLSTYGAENVEPVLYAGLDDLEKTVDVAAECDVVINTTLGYHPESVKALIKGLAKRKNATGHEVWMVHTSGTSNLADRPVSGKWLFESKEGKEFDDSVDDVYGFEKQREEETPYPQRTAELQAIDLASELGVRTLVIMSPTIFGLGTGLFNRVSIQVPVYIRCAMKNGFVPVAGEGKGVWDHVHVLDLAVLYEIVLLDILQNAGERLPKGKKGIMFSANGRHSWFEVAQSVAEAGLHQGVIQDGKVRCLGLQEVVNLFVPFAPGADELHVEMGLSSNSKTVASIAKKLGWKPSRGEDAWKSGFADDLKVIVEQERSK